MVVFKHLSIFILQHKLRRWRNSNVTSPPTTEIKMLILLCYFAVLSAALIAFHVITAGNSDKLTAAFGNYFACQATGTNPKCEDIKDVSETLTAMKPLILIHALMAVFPVVHLLYSINFGAIQQKCGSYWSSLHAQLLAGIKDSPAKNSSLKLTEL